MKAVSKSARKVFDAAIARLGVDNHVVIGQTGGAYIPLVVEKIGQTHFTGNTAMYDLFSFAHYGQQNGDAMHDPEVVMFKEPLSGDLYPISWRNDYVGVEKNDVSYGEDGGIRGIKINQQADNAAFCNMWAKNLKDQQGLGKKSSR